MSFLLSPALAVILALSVIYGALFHLWKGRNWSDLGRALIAAFLGFGVGQLIGVLMQLNVLKVGQVHVIEGTIFAWLFMLAIAWLKG